MKTFGIFFLGVLLNAPLVHAEPSTLQKVMLSFGLLQDPQVQSCPENPPLDSSDAETLMAKARAAEDEYNKCKPAQFYRSLIVHYPESLLYLEAYRRLVGTYLKAQDYILAINTANAYLENPAKPDDSEQIHLVLLRAVQGQIRQAQGKKGAFEFVAYSLGSGVDQNDEAPLLLNLRYGAFLEAYPKSLDKNEVLGMQNESRQIYGQKILQDARDLMLKMDYPGAFLKYDFILKWGPAVQVFPEALFETIKNHLELAWIVADPQLLSDLKLNQLLNRDLFLKSSAAERQNLSKQTAGQALKFLDQMKLNLPDNPWTVRAAALIY